MESVDQTIVISHWIILDVLSSGAMSVQEIIAVVQEQGCLADPVEILDKLIYLEAEGCLYGAGNESLKRSDENYFVMGRTNKGRLLWQRYAKVFGLLTNDNLKNK